MHRTVSRIALLTCLMVAACSATDNGEQTPDPEPCKAEPEPEPEVEKWTGEIRCEVEIVDDIGLAEPDYTTWLDVRWKDSAERMARDYNSRGLISTARVDLGGHTLSDLRVLVYAGLRFAKKGVVNKDGLDFEQDLTFGPEDVKDGTLLLRPSFRTSGVIQSKLVVVGSVKTADGVPVRGQIFQLDPGEHIGESHYYTGITDQHGRITVAEQIYGSDRENAAANHFNQARTWRYKFGSRDWWANSMLDWHDVVPVFRSDGVVDLGEFTFPGSVLEFAYDRGTKGKDCVKLSNGSFTYRSDYLSGPTVEFAVSPGRYSWALTSVALTLDGHDLDLFGFVAAEAGRHLVIRPELPTATYVEVEFDLPEGAPEVGDVLLDWNSLGDRSSEAHEDVNLDQPFRVLTSGRPALELYLYSPTLETSSLLLSSAPRQTLRARLATPPGALSESAGSVAVKFEVPEKLADASFVVLFTGPDGRSVRVNAAATDVLRQRFTVKAELPVPGEWHVWLLGAVNWGDPDGVFNAPLAFTLEEGGRATVTGVVDGDSFWEKADEPVHRRLFCEGRVLRVQGGLEQTIFGTRPWSKRSEVKSDEFGPTTVTFGQEQFPTHVIRRNQEKNYYPELRADLPLRVKVEWKLGTEYSCHGFRAEIRPAGSSGNEGLSCSANFVNGEAWLWAPAGSATLAVASFDLGEYTTVLQTEIEVSREGVLLVPVSPQFGYATIKVEPLGADYIHDGPYWRLRSVDGNWVRTSIATPDFWRKLVMLPGKYVLSTVSVNFRAMVEFEIRAGEVTSVAPECEPRALGKLGLAHDLSFPPGDHDGQFRWREIGDADHHSEFLYWYWFFRSDYIELRPELPVDCASAVGGYYVAGGEAKWLECLIFKLGEAVGIVTPKWRPCRKLAGDWQDLKDRRPAVRTDAESPWIDLPNGFIPTGKVTLSVGSDRLREQIEIFEIEVPDGAEPWGIPAAVRERLIELGWLDAD